MSFVRIFLSIPAVLVACALGSAGLGGCYDLSTSGPTPDDFASQGQSANANDPQEQDQTEARPSKATALDRSDAIVQAVTLSADAQVAADGAR